MPSFCPAPLRPATQDEHLTGRAEQCWVVLGQWRWNRGGVPGTGVLTQLELAGYRQPSPCGLEHLAIGARRSSTHPDDWRRQCVSSCTSTALPPSMTGGPPPAFDLPPEMTPRGDYMETWSP